MRKLSLALIALIVVVACEEKKATIFDPLQPPPPALGEIVVTVLVDGQQAVSDVTVRNVGTRATTPAPVTFEVTAGTYDVSATTPAGSKCPELSMRVTVGSGETVEVVFECLGLAGDWNVHYTVLSDPCEFVGNPEFDVPAEFFTDQNEVSVVFADAPAPIEGTYDPETSILEATTGQVPFPGAPPGVMIEEAWDVMFALDGGLVFDGDAIVTITGIPGGPDSCRINYSIDGEKE